MINHYINELSQWTYRKNAFSVSEKKSMNDFKIEQTEEKEKKEETKSPTAYLN